MAEQVLPGIGSLLVTFAIINSSLANANAGANAVDPVDLLAGPQPRCCRMRSRPSIPPTSTPVNAVHFQGVFGIVLAVGLGFVLADEPFPAAVR